METNLGPAEKGTKAWGGLLETFSGRKRRGSKTFERSQPNTHRSLHTDQYIPINTYRSIHTDECWTNYTKNTVAKLGLFFSFLMVHVMHFLTLVHAERGLMFVYNLSNVPVVVLRNLYNL